MKVWPIVLFLFIFSSMATVIEEFGGIGGSHVNEVGLSADGAEAASAEIYQVGEDGSVLTSGEEAGLFAGATMLIKGLGVFVKVIIYTIYIYGILISYGVSSSIALMIQGITTLIQSIGLVQFVTGRRVESR